MPQRGFDNKFDIDLQDGLVAEMQFLHILGNCKVEIKNDFHIDLSLIHI